ncbi:MAG: hypothetical protein IT162_10625 [Bryobacterales bacterium]|nr:hypothetical protein [Bryobacterales bacterium]
MILCEGSGDHAFFRRLLEVRGLPGFDIRYPAQAEPQPGGRGGFAALLGSLKVDRGIRRVKGIAIVTDCDESADRSFREVCKLIGQVDGALPPGSPEIFQQQTNGLPPVAVFLVPGRSATGNLETLCLQSMKSRWPAQWACVDELMACQQTGRWTQGKQEKARLRSLLSTICEEDPNTSLTHAWSRKLDLIPLDHAGFNEIAALLATFDERVAQATASLA